MRLCMRSSWWWVNCGRCSGKRFKSSVQFRADNGMGLPCIFVCCRLVAPGGGRRRRRRCEVIGKSIDTRTPGDGGTRAEQWKRNVFSAKCECSPRPLVAADYLNGTSAKRAFMGLSELCSIELRLFCTRLGSRRRIVAVSLSVCLFSCLLNAFGQRRRQGGLWSVCCVVVSR